MEAEPGAETASLRMVLDFTVRLKQMFYDVVWLAFWGLKYIIILVCLWGSRDLDIQLLVLLLQEKELDESKKLGSSEEVNA